MRARYLLPVSLLSLFAAAAAMAAPTVTAPDTATIGSQITITVSGSTDARDFVTIVPKGSRAGAYDAYKYVGRAGRRAEARHARHCRATTRCACSVRQARIPRWPRAR